MQNTFSTILSQAKSANSIIEKPVIGMLMYADSNANKDDIAVFVDWATTGKDKSIWRDITSATGSPEDHFECCEGKKWEDMELYFEENYIGNNS